VTATVPVVDLAEWRAAGAEGHARIASDVNQALRDSGIFLLNGHGVSRDVTGGFRSCAAKLMALPREAEFAYAGEAAYDSGSLEMRPPGGVGVPKTDGAEAPTSPDLELWTDGRWRALRHRVLAPSPSAPDEKLPPLAFFIETDPEICTEPKAAPLAGGRRLTPVRARRSILEKLGVSFDPADSTA
jgi:isopenicillin N synthase-like dioxygenase